MSLRERLCRGFLRAEGCLVMWLDLLQWRVTDSIGITPHSEHSCGFAGLFRGRLILLCQ